MQFSKFLAVSDCHFFMSRMHSATEKQEAQQLLGWPHQRKNAVSDEGDLTRP
jgi:hypothetical protein